MRKVLSTACSGIRSRRARTKYDFSLPTSPVLK